MNISFDEYLIKLNSSFNNYIIENEEVENELKETKKERCTEELYLQRGDIVYKPIYDYNGFQFIKPDIVPFISWEEIKNNIIQILKEELKYDLSMDIKKIIGVKTGGYYIAHLLKYILEEKNPYFLISCKTIRKKNCKTSPNDIILFENEEYLKKEGKILILDDVVRDGHTMKLIINKLIYEYNVKREDILTFSLFDSPQFRTNYSFNKYYFPKSSFIRLFCAPWGFDT